MDFIDLNVEYEDIFDDDLEIIEIIENGFPRHVNQRKNYFYEMDDYTFFRKFRLYKETVVNVLEQIDHELEYPYNINNSISPINQLLMTLRFYSTGGHLNSLADFGGMDTSTVSRIVVKVSQAIARLYPRYIKMPEDIVDEQIRFHDIARFPRTIGVIDGTHIKIRNPGGEDGEVFRNRKGYFSIITQIVCDSDLKITDIVARWPGSTHDATISMNSRICARFENREFGNGILLGDSGYALQPFLLTPLDEPVTRAQQLYNESFIRTRNIVERTIGVWKSRFPCLAYGMRIKTETALTVIIATAVLHNIARSMNEPEPPALNRDTL
ncbi:putative nuclease HARBI1 [Anoplophora glabripennis]|uniref:putative nuclease HARBI1 n=1 Tax=Anoplophora glabripennis TaxID=217634 RepID=UPI000C766147|nr:putative nuclease HARBI1 [Anoplophora glabripennis]